MSLKKRKAIEGDLERAEKLCAAHGTTLTELRKTVLRLILEGPGPLTAYQLLDKLKETRKSAVPPTIYRSLEFLTENGLIHKVERLNAFVPCVDHDHGHHAGHHAVQFLICGTCGTVAEIEDDAISGALATAAKKQGFTPSRAIVELDGTCASCSRWPTDKASSAF
jgi:Fur family zinc uptake transcriptional regulator